MPEILITDNVDGYRSLLRWVLWSGAPVAPRNQPTFEIEDATITHRNPSDVLAVGCGRKLNTRLAAYESLALIAGVSLPKKAVAVAPNLAQFINMETADFDGAYGPRLREQLPWIVNKLRDDPDTRQAVATIYRPSDLAAHSRDIPCTVYVRFAVRNGRLKMKTHMRSQDLWWGWPYDVVQFTQLGHTIANVLGIEFGPYVHHVDSLHVYERNLSEIQDFLTSDQHGEDRPMLTGLKPESWDGARCLARMLLTEDIGSWLDHDASSVWFAEQKLWEV